MPRVHRGKLKKLKRLYGGTLLERIEAKTGEIDSNGCTKWLGTKTQAGYPWLVYMFKQYYAHRVIAAIAAGRKSLKRTEHVCHRCDNPGCITPGHLFIGSPADNMRDCRVKKRHAFGERNGHAKLTKDEVMELRRLHKCGVKQRILASRYSINQQSVSEIALRKTWKHI
jgi:hypothetical protein